jgi:AcrR family transcriptional regulator
MDEGRSNAHTHYGPRIGVAPGVGQKRSEHSVFCYGGLVPTPTATRSDALRNRAKLVAAARELFARNGVDVSVEEITQQAEVGMGTLYRHFATKEELIDAVLADALDEILRLAETAGADEDAWRGLTTFLEGVLELRVQNRGIRDLIAAGNHGARHEEMRKRVRPLIRRMIVRAQDQGALRGDFKLDDVAFVLQSVGRAIEADGGGPNAWRRYFSFLIDGLRTHDV